MPDLVVVGPLGSDGLLSCLRPRACPERTLIDLTRMAHCEPLGLVAVAALADAAAAEGPVVLRAPVDPSVARYLARMRLGRVLDDAGVEHDLPVVREHPLDDVLVELRRFEGPRGAEEVAAMVHRAVEAVDPVAAAALHDGVVEAADNVPRHARRCHGYVAAQKRDQGRSLLFAVGDSGVGVLQTLRRWGALDAAQALEMAVREGVSETPEETGGTGLSSVVKHLSSLGGHLHLVSGDAALSVASGQRRSARGPVPFPGTLLQGLVRRAGDLPCRRPSGVEDSSAARP
ncbi:ATP-binding protein [Quadrisphaera sp. DSM 44207]|uniref:ATP-binding protein n=1 Tax=Quadrisphaera sp. DSM 44207 TaxID=1881057 RepID=UPI00088FAB4A|nr:ATP-binding protein [Quadrisphaera sp. DSM 44207]SDQ10256.1 hypothetical protein SAMN05428996_0536 [Quadrisphaera sp. DSM 44207]